MYQFIIDNSFSVTHLLEYRKDRTFYNIFLNHKKIASMYVTVKKYDGEWNITIIGNQDTYNLLHHTYEFLINRYHFEKVIYVGKNVIVKNSLKELAFYPKGQILQRVTDPYRLLCKKNTFDEEGLIIRQDNTDVIPFGLFRSKEKGCGWIATYNFLQYNKKNPDIYTVSSSLSEKDIFFNALGESIFKLYDFLKEEFPVHFYSLPNSYLCKKIRNSECGILLYYHKHGAHFTMYYKINENEYRFVNAIYGKKIILTPAEFMEKYTILHFASVICM